MLCSHSLRENVSKCLMMFYQRLFLIRLCTRTILLNTLLTEYFFTYSDYYIIEGPEREIRSHYIIPASDKRKTKSDICNILHIDWQFSCILSGHFIHHNICTTQSKTTAGNVSAKHDTFLTVFIYY